MSWCSLNRHIHVLIFPKVCPPGLHISLGIFQRLFELLEAECHKLDLAYAENCQLLQTGPSSFEADTNSLQELTTLSATAERLNTQIAWLEQTRSYMALTTQDPESSGPFRILTEELAKVKRRQKEIVSTIT